MATGMWTVFSTADSSYILWKVHTGVAVTVDWVCSIPSRGRLHVHTKVHSGCPWILYFLVKLMHEA